MVLPRQKIWGWDEGEARRREEVSSTTGKEETADCADLVDRLILPRDSNRDVLEGLERRHEDLV